ncbi:hypothetical protein DXG03_005655, partial [Asterophora parasitica]
MQSGHIVIHFSDNTPYECIALPMIVGDSAAKLTLVNATFLRERGRDSMEIFQAEMHKETEAGQPIVQDVLFKFAEDDEDLFDAMKHEADLYNDALKSLYDQGVPEFHGLYQGTLEVIGADSAAPAESVTAALVRLVVHLHDNLKILHGDLAPRNILNVDGRPFIIDFETSEANHKCHATRMDVVKHRGHPEPLPSELGGCWEIYKFLNDLNWWIPRNFVWYGYIRLSERMWRPADVFESETYKKFSPGASKEERWEKAME